MTALRTGIITAQREWRSFQQKFDLNGIVKDVSLQRPGTFGGTMGGEK